MLLRRKARCCGEEKYSCLGARTNWGEVCRKNRSDMRRMSMIVNKLREKQNAMQFTSI